MGYPNGRMEDVRMLGKRPKEKDKVTDDEVRNKSVDVVRTLLRPPEDKTDLIRYGELLTNKSNDRYLLERLTELDSTEVKVMSIYLTYAEKYNIQTIRDIIYMQMSLNFSKGRKRAKELVDLFRTANTSEQQQEAMGGVRGITDRFRGR